MKKVFALLALGAMFASCEADNQSTNGSTNVAHRMQQSLRVYYDNGGSDYGCKGSGGNCLPDVVITAKRPKFAQLTSAISAGGQATVTYFTNNKPFLLEFMVPSDIDGVISGIFSVEGKGTLDNKYYMILKNGSNADSSIEIVYPFVK